MSDYQELEQLQKQVKELMHVNSQWDLEYREQEEAFRRYRLDSQRAQSESQAFIAKLKEEKEQLNEEIKTLKYELERSNRQLSTMSERFKSLEHAKVGGAGGGGSVSVARLKELEEESSLLRQQLKTYQEDFEAERRDRERMSEEKQSAALKFEAEITSLRLQLDRCRNELTHYTAEANRLAQQLRLKYEYEQDQYKRHLESRGYIPRSPSGKLPPLDPYVENDPPQTTNGYPPSRRDNPSTSATILARGGQTSSAPSTGDHQLNVPHSPNERRSHTPSPTHMNGYNPPANAGSGNGYVMQNGSYIAGNSSSSTNGVSSSAYQQQNGYQHQPPQVNGYHKQNGYQHPQPYLNGEYAPTYSGRSSTSNGVNEMQGKFENLVLGRDSPSKVAHYPPVVSKGRFQCPRCARRFERKADCTDHKARCIS